MATDYKTILLNNLSFQFFDIECTWSLLQKRIVQAKLDIYVFITNQLQLTLKLSDNTIWHIIYINEINIENKSKTYVEIYSEIN